jgi:CBS domain-containing protein
MNTVAQILESKPDHTVYTMAPGTSAHEAVRLMAEKNIGALVVVEGGQVVGLVLFVVPAGNSHRAAWPAVTRMF